MKDNSGCSGRLTDVVLDVLDGEVLRHVQAEAVLALDEDRLREAVRVQVGQRQLLAAQPHDHLVAAATSSRQQQQFVKKKTRSLCR